MSGRKVPRWSLLGILAIGFASTVLAQNPPSHAPVMPQPRKPECCQHAVAPVMPQPCRPVLQLQAESHAVIRQHLPPSCCPLPQDATKQAAADAFFAMMKHSGMQTASQSPAQACVHSTPAMLTITAAAQPRPGLVGMWYHDIGSRRCVIAIEHDHMIITLSESRGLDGNPTTVHLTITADYHLARDGRTAVGLITGVDMHLDGDVPESEVGEMVEIATNVRKAFEDKPFAMDCRVYGETLAIGKVRMPEWSNNRLQPPSYIAGRYTSAASRPMPKQKVSKLPDPHPIPCISAAPIAVAGGSIAGGVVIGLPGNPAIAQTQIPTGDLIPPSSTTPFDTTSRTIIPKMPEPTPPTPTMTPPTPPAEVGSLLRGLKEAKSLAGSVPDLTRGVY